MISTLPDLDCVHVFCGAADQALARVYARLTWTTGGSEYRLGGAVTGPSCLYSETLSAHFPLVDRGPGPALLAEAAIPDPCFWSDELPFLYRIDVELKRGDAVVDRARRWLGIKRLGT